MRIKPISVIVFTFLLLAGWAVAAYALVRENASPYLISAVIGAAFFAAVVIYGQYYIRPSKQLRDIALLAEKVAAHVNDGFDPINLVDAPAEITPLVKAINDLLGYFEDKYKQERDFTANASHELRTPLAGIRLQTEIALKSPSVEQRQKALKNIIKAVDRGTRLVEQLLILSRLTADRADLGMDKVSVGRVAAQTVAELMGDAEKKQISLKMGQWDDCYIYGLEDAIGIMINNVIRNAIAYCPQGSYVNINVKCQDGSVALNVTDNGPGIPVESRVRVLGRFQKAERGTKIGTGLGLAIVKKITDLHNAALELSSGNDAIGLSVTIIFNKYKGGSNGTGTS